MCYTIAHKQNFNDFVLIFFHAYNVCSEKSMESYLKTKICKKKIKAALFHH